ncbi:thioesterase domain-containing protein [Candidatus Mycobacterium wuenschmannii]|uniref:Thioesterase TesA n=1 Tax=Candidatus Mycobacterium wuenschmannii TaxID=3027808 RepID=A0ABY8W6I0_9MYCO|nr:thioesterase domain-containing protein [Candidatus Mycobacterium wuenschmannii]WIM89394.1 thioesterase domain-containing protein [Candidatus Mycobacterium wuenschmannii]
MIFDNLTSVQKKEFPSWVKRFTGRAAGGRGATVVFPHAGGAATGYRKLATALAAGGGDTYIVQYPQRAERLTEPAAETVQDLARSLFVAGPWRQEAPLRLFGHSMGAVVAFEFARVAESRGAAVQKLWASAAPAPCAVEAKPDLPTSHDDLLVDMTDFGGTDAELLADPEFAELLVTAMRADYAAINRYTCGSDIQIAADISALGAYGDPRVAADELELWESHTSGAFDIDWFDGGHFYLDDHIDDIAARVNADG